tara:strand:+ start:1122 stop:1349 length:228 start_codon:yes stop_codon:yes gene_type:complete
LKILQHLGQWTFNETITTSLQVISAGFSSPVLAEVDKKTDEFSMKEADLAGCVQTMGCGGQLSLSRQWDRKILIQ